MKKVFLDDLPRYTEGIYKGKINWKETKNKNIRILYKNKEYQITIIDFSKRILTIKYESNITKITTNNFYNGHFGNILNLKTSKYKYKIEEIIKTKTGQSKIIECIRIGNKKVKGYRLKCKKCKYIYEVRESDIDKSCCGCPCCLNKIVVQGINDVATTNPELIQYLVNKEDGYKYSYGNDKKLLMKCPHCGYEKYISFNTLSMNGFGCLCEDGFSFPSKIVFNLLKEKEINAKSEYRPDWSNNKRYDFCFTYNNEKYIIEVNGEQHYRNVGFKRSLKEEQQNDKYKKELALKNGIKEENYIVLDCRYSKLEWIKENILNSKLNDIFDLSDVDWEKINKISKTNIVKLVCDEWNNGVKNPLKIASNLGISDSTVRIYLKRGKDIGICDYDSKNSFKVLKGKKILCVDNNKIYKSIKECAEKSLQDFGVNLVETGIINVCKGRQKTYKGYAFKYV